MALFTGSSWVHDEEERAFLQRRLALYAKVIFLFSLATDLINLFVLSGRATPLRESLFSHLITVLFGVMWLVCARGKRSIRFLRAIEALGLAAITGAIVLLGRYLPVSVTAQLTSGLEGVDPASPALGRAIDAYASMMVMLGGAMIYVLRAALIPSPPRLSFLLTAVLGLPFVLVPALVTLATSGALALREVPEPVEVTWAYVVWWSLVTMGCTVVSRVVYGLRSDILEARRLGQYTLEERLGEGGMGTVYRARHALLRRPTAVKLLPPDKAGKDSLERFEREVQLTATLTHPNTITVYDYGRTPDGVLYYAMELVDGPTLQQVVELDEPQPPERVAHILAQAAGALTEAHAAGLIHRDVKPANIMLCEQGGVADVVKVLDFGLVKEIGQGGDASVTNVAALKGTPQYMAPEAIRSPDRVSGPSDVYSLGGVGYFLLTGRTVFEGQSVVEVCSHHLHTEPRPPSEARGEPVPGALQDFVLACLEKDPERRPVCGPDLPARLLALEGVEAWGAEQARAWWRAHPGRPWGRDRQDGSPAAQGTIQVDFADRLLRVP